MARHYSLAITPSVLLYRSKFHSDEGGYLHHRLAEVDLGRDWGNRVDDV